MFDNEIRGNLEQKKQYIKYLTAASNAALRAAIDYVLPTTQLEFKVDEKYVNFKKKFLYFIIILG